MNTHVMLDLETLGTSPGCVILSIGATMFLPVEPGIGRTFYQVINRQTARNAGLYEEPGTVAWWGKQSPEARHVLDEAESAQTPSLGDTLSYFSQWLNSLSTDRKSLFVWGNGAAFDNALLAEAYRRCGFSPAWRYTNDRCYRTLKGMRPNIPLARSGLLHHHALDDAKAQAAHALKIMDDIGGAW